MWQWSPINKVLSFYHKDSFNLKARYAEPELLPGVINPWIASFSAKGIMADERGDLTCMWVKTHLNTHGIIFFDATYVEVVEEKEEQLMEVDGQADPAQPKKKKVVKKIPMTFITGTSSLDSSILEGLQEQEAQMHAADKFIRDIKDCHVLVECDILTATKTL